MNEAPLAVEACEPSWFTRIWWRARNLFRRREPSNLVLHAKRELEIAGFFKTGEDNLYDGMLGKAVLDMVKTMSKEGHSGMSASIAVSVFEKVARYQPLTPLTGEDDEWVEHDDGTFQNNRCSHVFKNKERGAYDINGKVFREPNGASYSGSDSVVPVTFPYTPKTEYIDVPFSEDTDGES